MKKKSISFFIRLIFTLGLIYYAFYKSGLFDESGRGQFINLLSDVRWVYVVISVLLSFVLNLSSAVKWFMLLLSKNIKVSLWRIYAYYAIGKFFNLILPTSMGGDVVRIFQLGNYTGRKHTAAASVIVERFTGMLTLILMAFGAVIINIKLFNEIWLTASLGLGILALIIIAWLILSKKPFDFIQNRLGSRIKILRKISSKLDKIRQPVLEFSSDKKAMTWAVINSIIFQLLAVINVWVSALSFSNELTLISCLVAVPIILFIMNIPISIGGIGLMEFGYVFTLTFFGASPALAISTALLLRGKSILDGLIGGIWYIALNNKEKSSIRELSSQTID